MWVTLNMTFCFSLCCPQNVLFSFVFCHINYDMSWCCLFWFIFLGFLCVFYTILSSLRIGKFSAIILSNIFYTPFSSPSTTPFRLCWYTWCFLRVPYAVLNFFLIILFAILFVWLSLFFLHKLPRRQRNMMRKPLYPPQIHQKIIWMLNNFHKTTSECWWRTPGTQKGSPISSKGGGRKFKRRKQRPKFRDRDPS